MNRELLQQALDVIIELYNDRSSVCGANQLLFNEADKVINALEAELAKPVKCTCGYAIGHPLVSSCSCKPRKEWVGLTDEERNEIFDYCDDGYSSCGVCGACAKCQREVSVIRATEAKLKEKNDATHT
jgi:hypothetical protein